MPTPPSPEARSASYYISLAYTHAPTDPRVRRHCESVARHGWRVVQVGIGEMGEPRVGRLGNVILVRRRRRRYRGGSLLRYAVEYVRFLLWSARVLRRIAAWRTVRVVHANNVPNFIVWVAWGLRRRGVGVILDIHDPVPELFLSKFGDRPLARGVARLLALEERLAASQADRVLTVNEPHRVATERHGVSAARIAVVANWADDRLFPRGEPRLASPFIAYHGTVAPRMALETLIEAIGLLRRQGIDAHGAIWGDGDGTGVLQQLRDDLGLGDVIQIPGRRMPIEEVRDHLARVGVGVVTLRRDPLTDLMLPTKLIEYVRLGIPAVATWTPTVDYYFPDGTVPLVPSLSGEALARALETVLADPAGARARARRAQELPVAQSWQQHEAAYIRLVEEVGGGKYRFA